MLLNSVLNKIIHLNVQKCIEKLKAGKTEERGRLSTVDHLIRVAHLVKKLIMFSISKAANLN
jgi:hypothetical protein